MNFFFFNDTATTEIYTLSLHDALPIFAHIADDRRDRAELAQRSRMRRQPDRYFDPPAVGVRPRGLQDDGLPATQLLCDPLDRKSTRLNSSHANISYAVFCLKKKINILN